LKAIYHSAALLSLFTVVSPFGWSRVAAQTPSDANKKNAQLVEIEPYYTRYKIWIACINTASGAFDGDVSARARAAIALCREQEDSLRALMGSKLGIGPARDATTVLESDVEAELQRRLDEQNIANQRPTVSQIYDKMSTWSSGQWHVAKTDFGCGAFHIVEGDRRAGDMKLEGETPFDIMVQKDGPEAAIDLFTPLGGMARALKWYSGKTVTIIYTLTGAGMKPVTFQFDNQVKFESDLYHIAFQKLIEFDPAIYRYSMLEIRAIDGKSDGLLSGYKFDIGGLEDAVKAYQRCAANH
jgi:hypothetical protein